MNLTILYRGPLKSCNFGCEYCPFAKTQASPQQIAADAQSLVRFVDWLQDQDHRFSLFFTPWGEALIWPHYQQNIVRLSRLENINRLAVQTNLSGSLDWLKEADASKINFWCTWHPTEMHLDRFLTQINRLINFNLRFSVGVVGIRENFPAIQRLRNALHQKIYLWINADKHLKKPYSPQEIQFLKAIDPLFDFNRYHYKSLGQDCDCGETVLSVDGNGDMQRCHFIKQPLGNIYQKDWENQLAAKPCTNPTCHCHIGYVHMPELGLKSIFGKGLLARIPAGYPNIRVPSIPKSLI